MHKKDDFLQNTTLLCNFRPTFFFDADSKLEGLGQE